ncbi:MAG: hypothetical protein J7623_27725 [Chitinophaga sp.]|uniref:hypothetical protein n=1 Tax=Chitinophaga sp. TaxID=1869181 RepID=UPI001B182BB2|nr:hypothetical protein [Chitinophaga sp.]MBO9732463.1 hypothetical protein [Chitinophaga sp.]
MDQDKDKNKEVDQQANPAFTKKDLLGKQEQSEPADLQEEQDSGEAEEAEESETEEEE